jgi:uncharacterized membrane protein YqjE
MKDIGPLLGVVALFVLCWLVTGDIKEAFNLTALLTGIAIFMAIGKGGAWWK